jgi:hypothetical protein
MDKTQNMTIRARVSKKQRQWIEEHEARCQMSLLDLEKAFKADLKRDKRALTDYRNFWATNKLPVYEYQQRLQLQGG